MRLTLNFALQFICHLNSQYKIVQCKIRLWLNQTTTHIKGVVDGLGLTLNRACSGLGLKFFLFFYFLCLPVLLFAGENFQIAIIAPDREDFFPSQELRLKGNKVFFEDNQIDFLKEEIEILRKQLTALQQYVERREEKINFLTDQLIELSLKLSEKERSLEESMSRLEVLSRRLTDLQSRWDLGQRIIQEKDRQISLASGVTSLEEEQFHPESKDKEIQSLKNTIDHLRREALQGDAHFKNYMSSRNKELDELKGVLQIYREKLRQANQMIKEKTRVLNELEIGRDQLSGRKNQKFMLRQIADE